MDGELEAIAADQFRIHLVECDTCQSALQSIMLEHAVLTRHGASRPIEAVLLVPGSQYPVVGDPASLDGARLCQGRRQGHVKWASLSAVAVGLASAALLIVPPCRPGDSTPIALAEKRGVNARFSAGQFDGYRPYDTQRAGAAFLAESIPFSTLGELERRGDRRGVLAALSLNGDLTGARRELAKPQTSSDAYIDRSAVALLAAQPEQALSYALEALRADDRRGQARWNKAFALKQLELDLVAADAFDDVATLDEPGWSHDAREEAAKLRQRWQERRDEEQRVASLIQSMVSGGAPLPVEYARRYPNQARAALYQALARAGDLGRVDELASLAEEVDREMSSRALRALITRVRASDFSVRGPIARALTQASSNNDEKALASLRVAARERKLVDIQLVLDTSRRSNTEELRALGAASDDPWWQLLVLEYQAYDELYTENAPSIAERSLRRAQAICRDNKLAMRCGRITTMAAGTYEALGRLDLAYDTIVSARKLARAANDTDLEVFALSVFGEISALRTADDIDPIALGNAFKQEAVKKSGKCTQRLYRTDFLALAALDRHRLADAAQFLAEKQALEQGECQGNWKRFNGERATARWLAQHGSRPQIVAFTDGLVGLDAGRSVRRHAFVEYLGGRASTTIDPTAAEAALRRAIALLESSAGHDGADVRVWSYEALTEIAARQRDPTRVLDLLSGFLGVAPASACVVGISGRDKVVVAIRGNIGQLDVAIQDVPAGRLWLDGPEVIPRHMRNALQGCRHIDVLAIGVAFGIPQILPDELAWSYRARRPARDHAKGNTRLLVITEPRPPQDLGLPQLRQMPAPPGAVILRDDSATPAAVLRAMGDAQFVEINAHGIVHSSEPGAASIALSPDATGSYLLTAEMIGLASFRSEPIVSLAACDAARAVKGDLPWGLATALLNAGARAVIAPTTRIPDEQASQIFASISARVQAGMSPSAAVGEERRLQPGNQWVSGVVVFE